MKLSARGLDWVQTGCVVLWVLLLLAPAVTIFAPTHAWDIHPLLPFAATLCTFGLLRLLAGRRLFLLATYPLAVLGTIAMVASFWRNADLLEMVLLGAVAARDVNAAFAPYALLLVALCIFLALPVVLLARAVPRRSVAWRWPLAAVLALGGTALWALSPIALMRAWPLNVITLAAAQATGRLDLLATSLPYAQVNPRKPDATWHAARIPGAEAPRETYVLVIGESVRADRLAACGGRAGWTGEAPGRIVYCDVMAGSSATHTSVPLLVSRELPGSPLRVSSDATFMRAFAQVGFSTTWLSVQERTIAWPDAQQELYLGLDRTDRRTLLAPLRRLLAAGPARQLLVIHAYNAHFAYCDRFEPEEALVPAPCERPRRLPAAGDREVLLARYDNAVHESTLFLDAVVQALEEHGGEVFMMFTSDHGENLLDDERGLFQHALGEPTRWDTRVPASIHANEAWRARHALQWKKLQANRSASLVHADLVPTLLGAAGIRYEEPRRAVTDLTAASPPPRTRWVVRRLGLVADGDSL